MPWKLLIFILLMAIMLVFVGFNIENRCTISFIFFTFESVPIIIAIFGSYILGLLSALSFVISRNNRIKNKSKLKAAKAQSEKKDEAIAVITDADAENIQAPENKKPAGKLKRRKFK